MKKNYLKSYSTKKTAKKTTKKTTKKTRAKKAPNRETKIAHILRLVTEIGDYAVENLCVQPAQMEELEWKLREYIK